MSSGSAVHMDPSVYEMAKLLLRSKKKRTCLHTPPPPPAPRFPHSPGFPARSKASDSPYQVPAGSAPNGLPQFPFCLLHFGLTQQMHTHTRKALQPGRSQRLETKKAPFRFIYLFVCLQFSPSVNGQGFRWLAPGKGTGRNQFSITSEITGHWIISGKSLWRANPVWKRAPGFAQSTAEDRWEGLIEMWHLDFSTPNHFGFCCNRLCHCHRNVAGPIFWHRSKVVSKEMPAGEGLQKLFCELEDSVKVKLQNSGY